MLDLSTLNDKDLRFLGNLKAQGVSKEEAFSRLEAVKKRLSYQEQPAQQPTQQPDQKNMLQRAISGGVEGFKEGVPMVERGVSKIAEANKDIGNSLDNAFADIVSGFVLSPEDKARYDEYRSKQLGQLEVPMSERIRGTLEGAGQAASGALTSTFGAVGGAVGGAAQPLLEQHPETVQKVANVMSNVQQGIQKTLQEHAGMDEQTAKDYSLGVLNAIPLAAERPLGAATKAAGRAVGSGAEIVAPKITSAVSNIAEKYPTATNIAKTSAVGAGIGAGVAELNDQNPLVGAAIGAVGLPVSKAIVEKVPAITRYSVSQMTGLSPDTISTIKNAPAKYAEAIKNGLDDMSLGDKVKSAIDDRLDALSETGKAYEDIRASNNIVKLQKTIGQELDELGVGIDKKGTPFVTSESRMQLSDADISKLKQFTDRFGTDVSELNANEILNARKALDNLSKWESGTTSDLQKVSKKLRGSIDDAAKEQLPNLSATDAKYAPERELLNQIKRDYIDPKTGQLKDTAFSKISNLTTAGKGQVLARLEQILPNIREEINILRAIRDVEYAKGQKVGAYARGAGLGAGLGLAATGGNPVAAVAAVLTAILSSPDVAVPIIKLYGGLIKLKDSVINSIIDKMKKGIKLNSSEKVSLDKIIEKVVEDAGSQNK